MKELTDREARQLAGAMRPNRKPLWIALGANVVLAVSLLGVPYVRGRMLAQAERADFVAFARCMIGGEAASDPGLSLPRGEREHYAAKVLYANADWPLSCRPLLKRLQPPDATFLWPSVKTAGADLRAAVELVDRELVALAKRRTQAPGRVPQRPLDAIKRLQAASVLFARAADVSQHADNDALRLNPEVPGLAPPARLPLMIGESQGMEAWTEAGTLQVLALDSHSLAYLRVENGKVDRQRARKKAFVRGVVRAGDTPYVVWAMPEARCAEREDGCVGRPTGLARFDKGSTELGEPSWRLEGHPAERLDRALSVSELGRVDLLARSSKDGAIDLLRARLPVETPGAGGDRKPVWLEPEIIPIVPPQPSAAETGAAAQRPGTPGSSKAGANAASAAVTGNAAQRAGGPNGLPGGKLGPSASADGAAQRAGDSNGLPGGAKVGPRVSADRAAQRAGDSNGPGAKVAPGASDDSAAQRAGDSNGLPGAKVGPGASADSAPQRAGDSNWPGAKVGPGASADSAAQRAGDSGLPGGTVGPSASADGAAQPASAADPGGAKVVAGGASHSTPAAGVARRASAMLFAGEPLVVLRAIDSGAAVEAALVVAGQSVQTLPLAPAAGSGAWVAGCSAGAARWLAYGSSSELRLARWQGAAAQPLTAASAELGAPIDPNAAARDKLLVLCTEGLARVLYVDAKQVLRQITCAPERCGAPSELAPAVAQVSAVQRQDVTVLAYYESALSPTIKLLRLDELGRPFAPASVAGSCWEPLGGLCGASTLIADAQRVALLTRDGPDLLALESANTGRTWGTLSGFQQRAAPDSGSASPMQQHRLRKGLNE